MVVWSFHPLGEIFGHELDFVVFFNMFQMKSSSIMEQN